MSGFDPSDFQDLASLVASRQRNSQINAFNNQANAINKQAQEIEKQTTQVAELKRIAEEQKGREELEKRLRNELFLLKQAAEKTNDLLLKNKFIEAYELIKVGRLNLGAAKHEHFTSLEFKQLAVEVSKYFHGITTYFEQVAPPAILEEINSRENAKKENERKLAENNRLRLESDRAINHKKQLLKLEEEKKHNNEKKLLLCVFFVVIILILAVIYLK